MIVLAFVPPKAPGLPSVTPPTPPGKTPGTQEVCPAALLPFETVLQNSFLCVPSAQGDAAVCLGWKSQTGVGRTWVVL